jgi:alkylated DNA repair dioxygenase AlkB
MYAPFSVPTAIRVIGGKIPPGRDRFTPALPLGKIEHMFASQGSLFGLAAVVFDGDFSQLQRLQLDDSAWLDYCPMWLSGDQSLFHELTERAEWSQPVVRMYEQEVKTPRLVARIDPNAHSVIPQIIDTLSDRYRTRLDQVSAGWYRDGNDSVAYHGDRIARERPRSTVATVSLGGARRFLIRPKGGGRGHSLSLGHGDLVVMGGSCQRTWEHAVPKVAAAEPRIALMFRHLYD